MSLFLPTHRKSYFDTIFKKAQKKQKRKKRKRKKLVSKTAELVMAQDEVKEEENEIVEELPEEVKSLPKVEEIKKIDAAHNEETYYSNLQMFGPERQKPLSISMVGKKAKLDYLYNYKNLHVINNTSETIRSNISPVHKYLQSINHKKLLPMPMGMLKRKGDINDINLNMYSMGDSYAEALSEGIQLLSPTRLQLNDNRLTEQGISKILSNLSINKLIELNLSNNKASYENLQQLSSLLSNRSCIIQSLKLEGLNLKDLGCAVICKALKKNNTLLELNLAKNHIQGNKTLSSFIGNTQSLLNLDLHWNSIRTQGAYSLSQAIHQNSTLKVLDLSWNSFSTLSKTSSIPILAEALSGNKTLIHVDISNNSFSQADTEIIAKSLESNHTILGIHMSGNHATVDELGFLSAGDERPQSAIKFRRILGFSRVNTTLSWRAVSNCWICERWSAVTFTWTGEKKDPVYLHLSFEDYEGDLLEPPDYSITRMCPPGQFYYMFTVQGEVKLLDSNIELIEKVSKQLQISQEFSVQVEFNQVNIIRNNLKGPDLLSINQGTPLPRLPHKKYLPAVVIKEWSIADSIFKDYKLDSAELLGKCFEYDWSKCKVPKLVKDLSEQQKIKNILSSRYQLLKEIYKYYSSLSPAGEIWSIGQMVFTDICNESKLIDSSFRLSDIDFHLKGALFQEVRNPRSPPNSLVRFQFMEILVRIALDKYFKTGICSSQSQAVELLLETNIIPNLGHVSAQKWRDERYLYGSVEKALKQNMHIVRAIYAQFSVRKVKPGQKGFMCIEEFSEIVTRAELFNETFTAREIGVAFNLAMMTQVQELDTDRQYQMSFIEFLEAISRVADLVGGISSNLDKNISEVFPKLIWIMPLNQQRELLKLINV